VISPDGKITARFDHVASQAEIETPLKRLPTAGATITVASTTTATTVGETSTTDATTTTAGFAGTVIEAKVTGSNVETAERRVRVDRGEKVRIRVEADRNEEVHLHGYDLSKDVAPGKPATIDFTADAPGVFEVELEQARLKLFEIQVP
jgi:FtsP/CotA-like multicopper oxidase with cupredoxin domain